VAKSDPRKGNFRMNHNHEGLALLLLQDFPELLRGEKKHTRRDGHVKKEEFTN
jgi:hypothetical protein